MEMVLKKDKRISWIRIIDGLILTLIFVSYFSTLIHITLFRFVSLKDILAHTPQTHPFTHGLNLIPFSDWNSSRNEMLRDILLNVLLFFPFGFLMQMISKKNHFSWISVLLAAFVSMGIETAQYYFKLGAADITDVISNILGVMIGGLCFLLWELVFKNRLKRARRVLLYCLGVFALLNLWFF